MDFSLLKYPLKALEIYITKMTLNWCKNNKEKLVAKEPLIDCAFNVYYFDALRLNPEDVEIVEKPKKEWYVDGVTLAKFWKSVKCLNWIQELSAEKHSKNQQKFF
ncbi:MAG: hypothetical protein DDT29_01682 [Dehalococcoidia bacterium]|nr:hypothetical protein [Bacillota bacterium]